MTTTPNVLQSSEDRTAWFRDCGWGVFCHYLAEDKRTADEWNAQVEAFDLQGLADQLESVKAPYFFITIGQNSGHYLAPNATYDRLVGIAPSKCSRRDLIADLYEALEPRGIKLLVYLPSGAPDRDLVAVRQLEWEWGFKNPGPYGGPGHYGPEHTGKRLPEFQRKWEAVIREWSLRWGRKIRGWWVDGCYFSDEMYRHADEPNFHSLAAALRAGNPDAILAFAHGDKPTLDGSLPRLLECHCEEEDYTSGEVSQRLPECGASPWFEYKNHRARLHILTYLGTRWCGGTPRFPDEMVVGFTKHVISKEGVITWEAPIQKSGLIPEPFLRQLGLLATVNSSSRLPAHSPCR